MKASNFEVARDSPEMVPRCCPGAGASRLGRDGPAPPLSRAAGALTQVCRQTGGAKNRRGSGTGGTPGRIRTDHIVRHRGGEPPRAHRRAGRRGTRPRRQRGESSSRRHGSCNGGKKKNTPHTHGCGALAVAHPWASASSYLSSQSLSDSRFNLRATSRSPPSRRALRELRIHPGPPGVNVTCEQSQ